MSKDDAMLESGPKPKLSDPESCGEDHGYNLSRVTAIARLYCGDCENYHITTPLNRLTGHSGWNGKARKVLIEFMQKLLAGRGPGIGPFDIVIAGAADTSILASCAHAANAATRAGLESVHFTILDKCETPLALCRDFAQLHGLKVTTFAEDLTRPAKAYPADVIIMHSVLSFIPQPTHVALLRQCGRWLKPGGRIFLWNPLADENGSRDKRRSIAVSNRARAMIEAGTVTINEPLAQFLHRLDRLLDMPRVAPYHFASMEDFHRLLAEAGVSVVSVDKIDQPKTMPGQPAMSRPHILAILGPPGAN